MFRKSGKFIVVILILLLVQLACQSSTGIPITGPGAAETAAASTVSAAQTQAAFDSLVQQLTMVAIGGEDATQIAQVATATPTATSLVPTQTFTPTNTGVPPTVTPVPSNTPAPATATAIPCYSVQFITDVTVPDNTTYGPNTAFVKTWRLKNTGSCTWTNEFDLVFVSGNQMGAPAAVDFPGAATPGSTIDLSVSMVSPSSAGSYEGKWALRSSNGVIFSLGANASTPFWVRINVQQTNPGNWASGHEGDFDYNYCSAVWRTGSGVIGCPSGENFSTGSVTSSNTPKLEGGYQDDEPAIIMIPSNGDGGFITGTFPAFNVQSGDRFRALMGCLDKSPKCNVQVQLNYTTDGSTINNLGTWTETSDGNFTQIDVDVNFLAGQNVQFILKVNNNGNSQDDRVFWLQPEVR